MTYQLRKPFPDWVFKILAAIIVAGLLFNLAKYLFKQL